MYRIKCDDYILHDLRHEDLYVVNPKLDLEVNKNGTLTFKIYPSHLYYNELYKLKSVITVFQDNQIIFQGRIIDDELGFHNEKQVTVEGIFAYLLDSIQDPFEFQGSVEDFFIKLISNHNLQVAPFQRFKIGQITVTDPNDYIIRSSIEYLSTKEVIQSRLLDLLGGYINIRYEDDGNYIDYLIDFENTSTQSIEFGENLIDLKQKIEAVDIKTAIIPLGAKIKDQDGNDTEQRLTIEEVNDGIKYLIDDDMVKQYGKIFGTVVYDDITLASNLLERGRRDLSEKVKLSNTIELTAIDLNNVNKNVESFHFCDYIRILSIPHDIDRRYLLKKINIDLSNPQNTKITLGETVKTLTDINITNVKGNNNIITTVNKINNDYISNKDVETIVSNNIKKEGIVAKNVLYSNEEGIVIANSSDSNINLSNMPNLNNYTSKRIDILVACDNQNYKHLSFELNSKSFCIDYFYVLSENSTCYQVISVEITNDKWNFKSIYSSNDTNKEIRLYKIEIYS